MFEVMRRLSRIHGRSKEKKGIFGVPLSTLLERDAKDGYGKEGNVHGVPLAVQKLVRHLDDPKKLSQTGIFRIPGSAAEEKMCKQKWNATGTVNVTDFVDDNTCASLIKSFIRELPGGLIPSGTAKLLSSAQGDSELIRTAIGTLPADHMKLLSYVLRFLQRVTMYENRNKMGPRNLSVIFAPSCFASKDDLASSGMDVQNIFTENTNILEYLIRNVDTLAPKTGNGIAEKDGVVSNMESSDHVLKSSVMTDATDIFDSGHPNLSPCTDTPAYSIIPNAEFVPPLSENGDTICPSPTPSHRVLVDTAITATVGKVFSEKAGGDIDDERRRGDLNENLKACFEERSRMLTAQAMKEEMNLGAVEKEYHSDTEKFGRDATEGVEGSDLSKGNEEVESRENRDFSKSSNSLPKDIRAFSEHRRNHRKLSETTKSQNQTVKSSNNDLRINTRKPSPTDASPVSTPETANFSSSGTRSPVPNAENTSIPPVPKRVAPIPPHRPRSDSVKRRPKAAPLTPESKLPSPLHEDEDMPRSTSKSAPTSKTTGLTDPVAASFREKKDSVSRSRTNSGSRSKSSISRRTIERLKSADGNGSASLPFRQAGVPRGPEPAPELSEPRSARSLTMPSRRAVKPVRRLTNVTTRSGTRMEAEVSTEATVTFKKPEDESSELAGGSQSRTRRRPLHVNVRFGGPAGITDSQFGDLSNNISPITPRELDTPVSFAPRLYDAQARFSATGQVDSSEVSKGRKEANGPSFDAQKKKRDGDRILYDERVDVRTLSEHDYRQLRRECRAMYTGMVEKGGGTTDERTAYRRLKAYVRGR